MKTRPIPALFERPPGETGAASVRHLRAAGARARTPAACLCLLIAFGSPVAQAREPSTASSDLVGTWKITVVPPAADLPSHVAFTSYAPGGMLIGSPIIHLPPPVARMGTAHGSWKKIGPNEFALTFAAFGYDASGQPVGIVKVDARQHMTGKDSFEGRSQLFICNLQFECPAPLPGYAAFSATRLPAEAPAGP